MATDLVKSISHSLSDKSLEEDNDGFSDELIESSDDCEPMENISTQAQ